MDQEIFPDLPNGWVWTQIDAIAQVQSGVGFPEAVQGQKKGDFPFVKVGDISQAFLNASAIQMLASNYLNEAEAIKLRAKVFPTGSILFAKIGEAIRLNRRVIAGVPLLADNNVVGLIPEQFLIIPKYLFYFMQTVDLYAYAQATTVPSVRKSSIEQIRLPLAPYNEQLRIVEAIETQFTRIDEGVRLLQRLRDNLKRYKAAVLKAACEGRLVPQDPDDEPASDLLQRILQERRAQWQAEGRKGKYVEPQPPDTADLPDLPDGWVWASVEQLAAHEPRAITDGPFGSNLKTSHYTDEGPRVIRLQNIGDGEFIDSKAHISPQHFELLQKHQIFAFDLVIAALGESLPRACIIPEFVGLAIVKADCIRFRPHAGLADVQYLNYALNSEPVKKLASGAIHGVGRPRLNQQEVKAIPIPLPPIAEQKNIVEQIELCFSIVQEVGKFIEDNLIRAERLRQSILKQAFEGKLVPQDPNDEPASVLLHHIQASRKQGRGKK